MRYDVLHTEREVSMATYLITGPSGSGKTTIGIELRGRGYCVVDADSAFGYLAERATGAPVGHPGAANITKEWYEYNGWIWRRDRVEGFLSKNKGKTVFLCGAADNEALFYPFFGKIFLLDLRPGVLRRRLGDRQDSDNNPVFVEMSLDELIRTRDNAERFNMITIRSDQGDARNSADAILSHLDENLLEKLSRWINRIARHRLWNRSMTNVLRLRRTRRV